MFSTPTDRRAFFARCARMYAGYAALGLAASTHALADDRPALLDEWLRDLTTLCRDLRTHRLSPELWQERMAILYSGIAPDELMGFIDFDRLIDGLERPDTGAAIVDVAFPEVDGLASPRGFGRKLFVLERGRAVVPHAHNNMVSAHFLVQGTCHVRTYHRRFDLERGDGFLWVEPSLDTDFGPGELLTMSDSRDNVHWLVAETDRAVTFDITVTDLFPHQPYPTHANAYSMIFIEPPRPRGSEAVRTAVIDVEEALARFG